MFHFKKNPPLVPYEENEVLEAGSHAKALASASFITDSNGDRYLVFDGDIGLLKQDDKYVVKEVKIR